ncbi:hypothetical protein Pint_02135 [Pistacia integerrima]|uniref:Uncharacterized protein n=1 Tax=Pistacia integerrima TaxID=434235 RepID=A0ACC0ZMK5_9ROSI|nr:hypothetical protein Pint_02135 [Pistacia integerrima]
MDTKNNSWLMVFVLFMCFSLKSNVSFGADTIFANQSLSGDRTIVSEGGTFELGFFKPGGNLVLFNESRIPVWSTNLNSTNSTGSASIEAVLLDEGNLVLRNWSSNSSMPLWQSFENPTDTWLPGMKIRRNKRTKENQLLTSWKNKEDPASGLFSLGLDPSGLDQYVILWNYSEQYWSSGLWNGQIFSMVPEMQGKLSNCTGQMPARLGFSFGLNRDNPVTFTLIVVHLAAAMSRLSVFVLVCQCQNNSLANGKSDKFLKIFNMVLPKKPQSVRVGSIAECESTCLNNCSCTAYAYENNACSVWVGDLLNLQRLAQDDTDGKTIYIKLAASDIPNPRNNKGTVIGGAVGGSAVLILLVGLFVVVYLRRRRTIKSAKAVEGDDLLTLLDPRLEGTADVEELSRICKVACWCIQDDETHRPSMSQVVQILEGLLEVTQSPVPRSLQVFADSQEHVIFFTDSSSNQSTQSQSNNT